MKFNIKYILLAIILPFLVACNNDDDSQEEITGEGSLTLKFDNVYQGNNLILGTTYTNSNGEEIKVSETKYIISNIVLTQEDGSTYTLPTEGNTYIVDEANETGDGIFVTLNNIPAANYTSVKFGIGIDEEQFNLGADGQGDFLTQAEEAGMMWSWAAGYKFVKFEGSFTSDTVEEEAQFRVHTGKTGDVYNYAEADVSLPDQALVRTDLTPQVHILTELSEILDGTYKINLSEGASIMGGENVQHIMADNVPNMFSVHHVHNN